MRMFVQLLVLSVLTYGARLLSCTFVHFMMQSVSPCVDFNCIFCLNIILRCISSLLDSEIEY